MSWHSQGTPTLKYKKMGRWKGATFNKYIREELHNFSKSMSTNMKHKFCFVNVIRGAYHDVTEANIAVENDTATAAA